MSRIQVCLKAIVVVTVLSFSAAMAQSPSSQPAAKPAAEASSNPSTATQVEKWTNKQWEAEKKTMGQGQEKVGGLPHAVERSET